ncbi:hypothetical protein GCM10011502_19540 [Oceanisphaera marina]|uniref:Methyltransferase FkbM domain-containing protein n=1 Tax=Oceanisphaera marina TaxID=2017550 RepID=A0ABQ1IMT2_9GAMM|nr:hypothetical protein [Oceanisphaera marina]GGB46273.1 hypothetical protein GCM10011502_19540 [Oceanisphaera marina]
MTSTPVHTLVHIGPGNGSQLPEYEIMAPARLVLIEPLPTHANSLRRLAASQLNAQVWEQAISCRHNNQPATFIEFNLSEASSLHQPSGLLQLYPGIKTLRQHQVQTQTPAAMMATLNLPKSETHRLVVEANGEETAIMLELAQLGLLQQFKQVQLALPATPLYINEQPTEQLPQQLQDCHFELMQENTDDPDIHVQLWQFNQHSYQREQQQHKLTATIKEQEQHLAQLTAQLQQEQTRHVAASNNADALTSQVTDLKKRNAESDQKLTTLQQSLGEAEALQAQTQKEAAALKEQCKAAEQAQQAAQDQLNLLQQSLAEAQAQLVSSEDELTKYKNYFQNRKKQHEAAEQQIVELTQQLSSANEQINQLTTQLQQQQQQQAGSKLGELEQKMEQLFADQAEQLRQNTNALGQHVTKMHASSNRQWQATLAVQHSLSFGEQPLQFSDTSISPELAQHLITLVQNNNYDLIIEFGSGHSTSLLARALLSQNKRWQGNGQLALHNGEPQTQLMPSEHDLPKRVISFEHNKTFYQQTKQALQQQGLSQIVELVYAPLVDYSEQGSDYLFYDCKDKIKQLAQILAGREAHILVLVDGPSSTQEQESARYPALSHLLKNLAAHKLDIILDDYHRNGEQHIAEQWRSQLKARSLHFNEASLHCEKGALMLEINH